jgi:two-component system phosphate regulon sensor histidine kinase PhoR
LHVLKQQEQERAATHLMLVHELRAPVTASKSLVAALRFKGTADPLVDSVLGRIENRMDQLLELVNDILLVSGVRSGQPLGQVVECDLAAETRSVCAPYEEEAAAQGLSMTVDVSRAPASMRITPQAYRLILSNLVSNAIKYTLSGWVRVVLRQEGDGVVLEVCDSGIGIPTPDMDQLFTEFFRASNARSARIPGTGLGLAGVKALVDRCGGGLDVTSREQRGSQFTVRLPLCGPSSRQVPSPQPRRILQSCLA